MGYTKTSTKIKSQEKIIAQSLRKEINAMVSMLNKNLARQERAGVTLGNFYTTVNGHDGHGYRFSSKHLRNASVEELRNYLAELKGYLNYSTRTLKGARQQLNKFGKTLGAPEGLTDKELNQWLIDTFKLKNIIYDELYRKGIRSLEVIQHRYNQFYHDRSMMMKFSKLDKDIRENPADFLKDENKLRSLIDKFAELEKKAKLGEGLLQVESDSIDNSDWLDF